MADINLSPYDPVKVLQLDFFDEDGRPCGPPAGASTCAMSPPGGIDLSFVDPTHIKLTLNPGLGLPDTRNLVLSWTGGPPTVVKSVLSSAAPGPPCGPSGHLVVPNS